MWLTWHKELISLIYSTSLVYCWKTRVIPGLQIQTNGNLSVLTDVLLVFWKCLHYCTTSSSLGQGEDVHKSLKVLTVMLITSKQCGVKVVNYTSVAVNWTDLFTGKTQCSYLGKFLL